MDSINLAPTPAGWRMTARLFRESIPKHERDIEIIQDYLENSDQHPETKLQDLIDEGLEMVWQKRLNSIEELRNGIEHAEYLAEHPEG